MSVRSVQFAAIVLAALALIPSGAHFFALPNKIALPQQAYFTVQGIYNGWALLGVLLIGALAVDGWLAFLVRGDRIAFLFAAAAVLCMALSLAVFFIWVFPSNQTTDNWTFAPANWQELRTRWEYGHAASAALAILALCSVTASVLSRD